MSKFIAIYIEDQDGCDYSIGCGVAIKDIEADSMEEAFEKVVKDRLSDWDPNREYQEDPRGIKQDMCQINQIRLIRVAEEDNNTLYDAWYANAVAAYEAKKEADQKVRDHAELNRLQKKLGFEFGQ